MSNRYSVCFVAFFIAPLLSVTALAQQAKPAASVEMKALASGFAAESVPGSSGKLNCEACGLGQCEKCHEAEVALASVGTPEKTEPRQLTSTHQQTSVFAPKLDGKAVTLSTFRVRPNGQIVVGVAPLSPAGQADSEWVGFVQVYSPTLELVNQIGLPFQPDALDIDTSGNMYVGGEGQLAKLSASGDVLLKAAAPNLEGRNIEQIKEDLVFQTQQQQERSREVYQKQMAVIQSQIEKIEAIDEDDRSKSDISRLASYAKRLEVYERLSEGKLKVDEKIIASRIKSQFKVTSIAVTASDLFVATNASTGTGYVVYRMDHELKNAECILEKLRGCCGQMDVHALGDKIYVAENTKYRVGVYDRDGKEVRSMGQRLNKDNQGFGGCCNPMNVLCCPDGSVLTSESTLGKIKRFDADGELVGNIGTAKIGTGCKNVAFGFDESRDRYFVQYKDKNSICILDRVEGAEHAEDSEVEAQAEPESEWKQSEVGDEVVVGVGLLLKQNEDGSIVVIGTVPQSPASEKKLVQEGDVLVAVGDINKPMIEINGKELAEVVNLIRGPVNTAVRLKFHSADGKHTRRTNLVRARLSLVDGQ